MSWTEDSPQPAPDLLDMPPTDRADVAIDLAASISCDVLSRIDERVRAIGGTPEDVFVVFTLMGAGIGGMGLEYLGRALNPETCTQEEMINILESRKATTIAVFTEHLEAVQETDVATLIEREGE